MWRTVRARRCAGRTAARSSRSMRAHRARTGSWSCTAAAMKTAAASPNISPAGRFWSGMFAAARSNSVCWRRARLTSTRASARRWNGTPPPAKRLSRPPGVMSSASTAPRSAMASPASRMTVFSPGAPSQRGRTDIAAAIFQRTLTRSPGESRATYPRPSRLNGGSRLSPGLRFDTVMKSLGRTPMAKLIEGRESGFKTNPDYKVLLEPSPRRVRVVFNGETIADSTNAHLLFETRHLPVYYFPRADVRMDLMAPTDHHSFCPYKGTASYWTIRVGPLLYEIAGSSVSPPH